MHAPLITEIYGLLGTRIYNVSVSNFLMISFFKNGLSEKPPTMKIKLIFSLFVSAYCINYSTFVLIFSNNGWKKETIKADGNSTFEAPLTFKANSGGFF